MNANEPAPQGGHAPWNSQALNNLVNCKAGISAEMAIRLDTAFRGSAEGWLALQTAYDLAQS